MACCRLPSSANRWWRLRSWINTFCGSQPLHLLFLLLQVQQWPWWPWTFNKGSAAAGDELHDTLPDKNKCGDVFLRKVRGNSHQTEPSCVNVSVVACSTQLKKSWTSTRTWKLLKAHSMGWGFIVSLFKQWQFYAFAFTRSSFFCVHRLTRPETPLRCIFCSMSSCKNKTLIQPVLCTARAATCRNSLASAWCSDNETCGTHGRLLLLGISAL